MAAATSNLTLTENSSVTYASTTSARLDFFFDIMSGSNHQLIHEQLAQAWKEDPLDALKLAFQLRDIRDGKGDRPEFYHALQWLRQHHPKTFLANLPLLPEIGYWKDLAELLLWETVGFDGITAIEDEYKRSQDAKGARYKADTWQAKNKRRKERREALRKAHPDADDGMLARQRAERARQNAEAMAELSKMAREGREQEAKKRRRRVRTMLESDDVYRKLHVEVARLFATALRKDLAQLKQERPVSLAAKWAPTPRARHDSYTLLATTIAQLLYPEAEHRKQDETMEAYVMRVRIQYQRDYLTPLRARIHVIETLMSHGQWDKIVYEQVPSVCMKKQKRLFTKHDDERFAAYLAQVEKGEKKITSKALMPHQLVDEAFTSIMKRHAQDEDVEEEDVELARSIQVLEAQWKSYVDNLAKEGTFESAMAVCDVSGSMEGTPMNAAIALSLLITELTRPPFNQLLISFSEQPRIHHVEGGTLLDRVQNVSGMHFGYSTNFQAVFDLILQQAKANSLAPEHMVKRLFVFSDMEFDQACTGGLSAFNTDYAIIERKFAEAGYPLPEMIFWNLRGSGRAAHGASKPVTLGQKNIGMLAGFSGHMLKLFLRGQIEEMNAWAVVREALDNKKYERLVILD
ncbi:hypothetical protein SYNPS1DRAFT_14704 [Syncephalis pseudoplumigaleata]|uniref:VWFA domain-containing protein n=1 Tax=Syncephalis pseudoplumigaleata TaxID=1712513 RepID=A0A4P9Z288_9FUNG|nr:hypothetical protein SYNPS1DRAFT_14704 [Syncephalis pseudoplumigaleata]|eukprot:RKP26082.1 hypothetical protein SYNPS1DRAFT_14704 [Syncephalis pseudoplumigaleata]